MTKVITKIAGAIAIVALAAVVAVPSASALTAADIELLVSLGVIPADKASAAMALATGGGAPTSSASASCAIFTRDLTLGSTGADVVSLQSMLQSTGHLVIPVGVSKGYFGALTQGALSGYQASRGIAPAAGYFGPITRSSITCNTPSTDGGDDMDDDMDDENDLGGSEASFNDFNANSKHSNEDIEEGESQMVLSVDFEVDDGDALLQRVDVQVQATDETAEDEPWDQIESIALYLNGEKIAEKDTDDEDDWSRESTNTDVADGNRSYRLRFTGLSERLEEGDEAEIEVEVTTPDSMDSGDLPQSWAVWIPDNGIRAIDGAGIDQFTGSDTENKEFDIEAAQDGTVDFQVSDDDLDTSILIVDQDDKSSEMEIFRFEIDNEDADIFLNTLVLTALSTTADVDEIISELKVEIDGTSYDFDTSSTTLGTTGQYTFDFEDNNDEVPIEEDDTVEVIVMAVFNQASGNFAEGETIQIDVETTVTTGTTAEGQQSGDASSITGSAQGAQHVLRSAGILLELVGDPSFTKEPVYGPNSTVAAERGFFTMKVEITALEDDVWIYDTVGTSTPQNLDAAAGFVYSILSDGTTYTGTSSASIKKETSNTKTNNRHKINDGGSETFTLEVRLDPDASDSYGISLDAINFSTTSAAVSTSSFTVPTDGEYDTVEEFIKG